MDKAYEIKYHEQEGQNWWFVARRDMIFRQLQQYNISPTAKILDIGSSGGILVLELIKRGYSNVYALDYSKDAIDLCQARGLKNSFVMDGHNPEFPDNEFDVIIASDCLEHLADDRLALQNWYRILKPGGKAIIYVPAFMWLWSGHDDINFHYRRYTSKELLRKLKDGGFEILETGYWDFFIFFPTAVIRIGQKLFNKSKQKKTAKKDQLVLGPKWINSLLISLVTFENRLHSWIKFPFGVSTFSIAKK